jgi:hypothetical protein
MLLGALKRAPLWVIAFAFFVLVTCTQVLACVQDPEANNILENGTGSDTLALQAAIDNASGGTEANPYIIQLEPATCESPYTLSENGTTGRAIFFNGDEAHISIQGDPTTKTCIKRATGVGTTSENWFQFFQHRDGDTTDIRYSDLIIHGNNNGSGFLREGANYGPGEGHRYDTIFNFKAVDAVEDNASTYIDGITLDDIEMKEVFGVCWYSAKVTNLDLNEVDCIDPTKDGFTFGFGSVNGTMTNSSATMTGDDALAFNSCWLGPDQTDESVCAMVRDWYVRNFKGGVDPATYHGAAFYSRGAHAIRVENSTFQRSAVGLGNNAKKGSVMIEWSGDPGPKFSHSIDVDVVGSTIEAGNVHAGFRFEDSDLGNINIGDGTSGNAIVKYNANDWCGVKGTVNTNEGQIFGENEISFQPNNANKNVCYN